MSSVFYSEYKDDMPLFVDFINDAVIADSKGIFPFMVAHEGFARTRVFRKCLYLCQDPFEETPSDLWSASRSDSASFASLIPQVI